MEVFLQIAQFSSEMDDFDNMLITFCTSSALFCLFPDACSLLMAYLTLWTNLESRGWCPDWNFSEQNCLTGFPVLISDIIWFLVIGDVLIYSCFVILAFTCLFVFSALNVPKYSAITLGYISHEKLSIFSNQLIHFFFCNYCLFVTWRNIF